MNPYVRQVEFDAQTMDVFVEVVGHPTDALKLAHEVCRVILSGHGAWCITKLDGAIPSTSMHHREFTLNVRAMRIE